MMKIAKWGNSLGIRIPRDVARELGLSEGDEVTLSKAGFQHLAIEKMSREEALASLKRYRGMLPKGFRFNRAEANGR